MQSRLRPEKGMGGPETQSETDLGIRDAGKQKYGQQTWPSLSGCPSTLYHRYLVVEY